MSNSQFKLFTAIIASLVICSVVISFNSYLKGNYNTISFNDIEEANTYTKEKYNREITLPIDPDRVHVEIVNSIYNKNAFRKISITLYYSNHCVVICCINDSEIFSSFLIPEMNDNILTSQYESLTRITKGDTSYYIHSFDIEDSDSVDKSFIYYISFNGILT